MAETSSSTTVSTRQQRIAEFSAFLVRFADDFVIGFTDESDARRVLAVLPQRFGKYGLTIHPDKTRLLPFHRPRRTSGKSDSDDDGPGTFDLLGFTHYWDRSQKGGWVIKKKTSQSRFTRAVRSIYQWCKTHCHQPIGQQYRTLCQKVRGHLAYYGLTGNYYPLRAFRRMVHRVWRKWLARRNRSKKLPWARFNRMLERYPLPNARVVHSVYRTASLSLRNRMPELGTSGSVGALGEQSPGATRPPCWRIV